MGEQCSKIPGLLLILHSRPQPQNCFMYYMLSPRASKKPMPNSMKGIDWKLVASNVEMKETFTVAVHNHSDASSKPSDDIETTYNKLKQSTEEVALTTLPKKEKLKNNISMPTFMRRMLIRVCWQLRHSTKTNQQEQTSRNVNRAQNNSMKHMQTLKQNTFKAISIAHIKEIHCSLGHNKWTVWV